ncbi:MAG: SDR family oxidoreductase [Clostridia bacterium]|nr:SDR family oxidoreductase [Deltaproteobacteria bacterium]
MNKQVALVTGANKGIGYEIARQLATKGMTVLLGARDTERGRKAAEALSASGDVRFVQLDVSDAKSITKAAEYVTKEFSTLDVLVNNAGIVDPKDGPPSTASLDAVRRVFETNFYGVLAATQAFLPMVRKSNAGRIVNVSSGLGSLTLNADPSWDYAQVKLLGYNGSKAVLNMLTVQLAYELRDTTIKVNTVNPGYTKTDLNDNQGFQTLAEGAEAAVRAATLGANGPTGSFFNKDGDDPW